MLSLFNLNPDQGQGPAATALVKEEQGHKAVSFLEKYGTLLGLFIICAIFTVLTPNFLHRDNLLTIVTQASAVGIISIGLTLVMITGNTDLSFGSICGLSGMTTAFLMSVNGNPLVSILAGLGVGVVFGLLNGWLVVKIRIQPMVATIAVQAIAFGLAYFYSGGVDIHSGETSPFTWLGKGFIGSIPVPAVLLLIIMVVAEYTMRYTRIGRYFYAIGGNSVAAKFSGIHVSFYKVLAYVIAGVLASTAGILMFSRLSYGAAYTGQGYLLDAFAAVFLGFTLLKGGKANITGSVVGALFMGILNNGFQLLNVSFVLQILLKGVALLLIVSTNSFLSMKKE